MTLVVENGTGMSTAESYASVAEATAYHSARGNTAWAALTNEVMEQSLRKATAYMVGEYRMRWGGTRLNDSQALDWPRSLVPRRDAPTSGYYANDAVPTEVKNACASLALRASTAALHKDQTQRKSSVTVGPISTTYEAGSKIATTYSDVEAVLKPMLATGTGQIRMVRA